MSKNSRNFYNFLGILGLVLAGNMLVTPSVKATVSCYCAVKSKYDPELNCIKLPISKLDNEACRQECLINGFEVFMAWAGAGIGAGAWRDCNDYVKEKKSM